MKTRHYWVIFKGQKVAHRAVTSYSIFPMTKCGLGLDGEDSTTVRKPVKTNECKNCFASHNSKIEINADEGIEVVLGK